MFKIAGTTFKVVQGHW